MNTAFIGLDYIVDISHPAVKIARCAQQVIARNTILHAHQALSIARQQQRLSILGYRWPPAGLSGTTQTL